MELLYVESIKDLKFLKKKKPLLKWASREDITKWYPKFPFIAYISSSNRMTFSVLEAESENTIFRARCNRKKLFKTLLEIE